MADKSIKKAKTIMDARLKAVEQRRSEWPNFTKRLKVSVVDYSEIFKNMQPWGHILSHNTAVKVSAVLNQDSQLAHKEEYRYHLNACSISLGNYSLGISYEVFNVDQSGKRFTAGRVESETGASLSFSQLPSGEIALIFYPAESKVHKFLSTKLIYRIYESPAQINDKEIRNAIRFLIEFGWYTSALASYHGPRYWLFRFRLWWKSMDVKTLLKALPYAGESFAVLIDREDKGDA